MINRRVILTSEHICNALETNANNHVKARHDLIREVEKALFLEALERTGWNQSKAAELCGINRGTLRTRMAEFGWLQKRDEAA